VRAAVLPVGRQRCILAQDDTGLVEDFTHRAHVALHHTGEGLNGCPFGVKCTKHMASAPASPLRARVVQVVCDEAGMLECHPTSVFER
jgi:hypothetical protein